MADVPPAPTPPEDFGQYVIDHERGLAPFFANQGNTLLGEAAPLLLQWTGTILFIALALGWVIDVLLGRGFANLFAPARDEMNPSLWYATGRLGINVSLLILLQALLLASVTNARLGALVLFLIVLFGLISAGLQIGWITWFYRTKVAISVFFFLTLIVVHGFLTLGVAATLSQFRASAATIAFMNGSVAPKIDAEVLRLRKEVARLAPSEKQDAGEASGLQSALDQDRAEQIDLREKIAAAKVSERYLYSQAVKIQARGDLPGAYGQLTALLARFPNGPITGLVQGQLTQVSKEMSAQKSQLQMAEAAKLQLAAKTQADLLARAGKGQATLSELRRALLGKSPGEVSALFGAPSETASNCWGFSQQMVLNPLTNEHSGLAVYFADGSVQSVDYYYGRGVDK